MTMQNNCIPFATISFRLPIFYACKTKLPLQYLSLPMSFISHICPLVAIDPSHKSSTQIHIFEGGYILIANFVCIKNQAALATP